MAKATKNVSYEDLLLDSLQESPIHSSDLSIDDFWYASIEARETDLTNESIHRGALYLAKKVA